MFGNVPLSRDGAGANAIHRRYGVSRLGILGHLGAQVLPFVGFDPRRAGALAIVEEAVTKYGCVGVKFYPPMGSCLGATARHLVRELEAMIDQTIVLARRDDGDRAGFSTISR